MFSNATVGQDYSKTLTPVMCGYKLLNDRCNQRWMRCPSLGLSLYARARLKQSPLSYSDSPLVALALIAKSVDNFRTSGTYY